ncbi:MAG: trypsin-like peptidase domain-containing protein [Planctomycetota bacterium]
MKWTLSLLLCLALHATRCVADGRKDVDPLDRVVCIESRVPSQPTTGKLCSAFIVDNESQLYLVTAGHAAAETNADSRLRYRDRSGASQWVTLRSLIAPSKNPWHRDPTSDFAVAVIEAREGNQVYLDQLVSLSIPLSTLCKMPPPRTTSIVTIGFPLGIGAGDDVSPLAVVGNVASRVTLADNSWGKEPILYCAPALAQGTSGGPTFTFSREDDSTTVVGMYVGVVNDATGAKLSKMVPAHLIRDSISELGIDEED